MESRTIGPGKNAECGHFRAWRLLVRIIQGEKSDSRQKVGMQEMGWLILRTDGRRVSAGARSKEASSPVKFQQNYQWRMMYALTE